MSAKCLFAIWAVIAFLAVAIFSCPSVCAAEPAPQPANDIVKETDAAIARETAEKQKEWSETMEKLRAMWKDLDVKIEPNEVPDPLGIFGLNQLKENAEAAAKSTAKIVVTEPDLRALDAYAAGQFAQVEESLKDAANAPGKRPFPLFLRGCALFELKRFAEAAASFDEALALQKDSRMCCLLAEMSRNLEKSPDATDEDIWTAFDFAYKATMDRMPMPKEEGDSPSLAAAFTSPISFDPIRVRLDQVVARIRRNRQIGILQDYLKATDLNQQLDLALLMDKKLGRMAIVSLSKEHPENKKLQVFAYLVRYYGGADDKLSQRGPDYAQDFAAAQADEPENGCLVLLGIADTEDNYDQPLNAAETDILKRAVHCKEFNTHFGYRGREAAAESRAQGGECFESASQSHAGSVVLSTVRHVAHRADMNILKLFEAGKEAEAQALLSDVRLLAAKVRSENSDNVSALLSANVMTEPLNRKLQEYAVRLNREDLLEKILPEREAVMRSEAVLSAGVENELAFWELPVRRMPEIFWSDKPFSFYQDRALRLLRLYPDRFRNEAIEDLRHVSEAGYKPFDFDYRAVVILQTLKDPRALPILEPIIGHADPLLSRLAQEAVADIESNP